MEKRIDGEPYDTENDTEIASSIEDNRVDNSENSVSGPYNGTLREEHLCVTDNGAYFTYVSDKAYNHKELKALSEKEAREWCRSHNEVEAAKEHFPQMEAATEAPAMEVSKTDQIDDIQSSLSNIQRAIESLACKVEQEGHASEALTIHDALRAVQNDVEELREKAN